MYMNMTANSRRPNGVLPMDCLYQQKSLTDREASPKAEQTLSIIKSYQTTPNKKHVVSKSIKTFFMKFRGTAHPPVEGNDNQSPSSLTSPFNATKEKIPCTSSLSSYSKQGSAHVRINRTNKKQKKTISKSTTHAKNHHLPVINSLEGTTYRRCSNNRHTLDFSTIDSGVMEPLALRRANSLCNSSVYSTFASPQKQSLREASSYSLSTATLSTLSSASLKASIYHSRNDDHQEALILDASLPRQQEQESHHHNNHRSSCEIEQRDENSNGIQKRLWQEDATLCSKTEIAEFLGSLKKSRAKVLHLYMNNFDFSNQRLDIAFRTLCTKLYLKAESQQLDRIIEAFAKRYFECNPSTVLHCFDAVYAVAYALLLLNTDLHVVGDRANKMTRSSFVRNTMATVQTLLPPHLEIDNENSLQQGRQCASLSSRQSVDSASYHLKRNDSSPSSSSSSLDSGSPIQAIGEGSNASVFSLKFDVLKSNISRKSSQSHTGLIKSQRAWLNNVESLLRDMYTAVKAHRIDQAESSATPITTEAPSAPVLKSSGNLHRSRTLPKNSVDQSYDSIARRRKRRGQSFILSNNNSLEDFTMNTFPQPMPVKKQEMLKQGLVMRKHVMESTDKRARHRQWQLCYVVVTETELIMYKPTQQQPSDENDKGRRRKSTSMMLWNPSTSFSSLQDIVNNHSHWQADEEQAPLAVLEMNHVYATAIPPPGWNSQRPHVFRLETGDGGSWLFESTDMFAMQAWVELCNATAAKISKGPLLGAISNIDYGWGAQWDNTTGKFVDVPIWYPPSACMINSTLALDDQCDDIQAQIDQFNSQLNAHRELKLSVDKKFSTSSENCSNGMQALKNWDRKLHFILHELTKLRCYKEILLQEQQQLGSIILL